MKFEYDPEKSKINLKKHGITLEDAKQLWSVSSYVIPARTVEEPRWMRIGYLKVGQIAGKCFSCVFTLRGEIIRLISARRSRPDEEKLYYENILQKKN